MNNIRDEHVSPDADSALSAFASITGMLLIGLPQLRLVYG